MWNFFLPTTHYSNTSTYANSVLRDFQISSICLFPPHHSSLAESLPETDEIGNLIEEVIDVARQINLEVDRDDIKELLDSHNQELTIELIEMYEQEQDVEELCRSSEIRRSNDVLQFDRPQFD
ncbi:hypothetical protein TNCV_262691 [Trichonephila clavipes]|nr:hypothetical protein TNCV_262691 [Trichonephila clavipes]